MKNFDSSVEFTFNIAKFVRIFFFAAFALVSYLLFRLAEPFLTALLLSCMMAIAFYPINRRLRSFTKKPGLSALLLTLAIFLAAFLPLVWFVWFLVKEANQLLPTLQENLTHIQNMDIPAIKSKLPAFLDTAIDATAKLISRFNIDTKALLLKYAQIIGSKITMAGSWVAQNILIGLLNMIVFIVSLFVWFRDGERLFNWAMALIPMQNEHKNAISKSAYETYMAIVMGVFLTAFAQGLVAMIGFWIAGVRLPVLLGVFTMISSLLGASFLVTLPVAIFMFSKSFGWGIFLIIWGPILVGMMDNLLKPILIGSKARMPLLLIFFSIIGGIKAFGLMGLIAGPIIMATFLTFVKIYKKVVELKNYPAGKTAQENL